MVPNPGAVRFNSIVNLECWLIVIRCPLVYIMSFVFVLILLLFFPTDNDSPTIYISLN